MTDLLARLPGLLAFYLSLSAPVPLSLFCARRAAGSPAPAPDRFLAAAVCWCYGQAALGTALGALGLFRPAWAASAQFALFAAGLALLAASPRSRSPVAPPPGAADPAVPPRAPAAGGVTRVLLLLPALAAAALLRDGLIWPPVESDTLGYHLPLLFKLIQEGRFAYLGHWDFQEHFPRAWETLSAVLCLPGRRDTAALAPNVLAYAVFGCATAALARRAGAGRAPVLAAAALALLSPILAGHLGSLHVDLPFAAFFLAALHFARGYAESRSAPQGACLAMAAALCLGIRGTAMPYLALLAIIAAVPAPAAARRRPRAAHLRRAAAGLAFLLPGLYWYGRNYALAGNPFYDVRIEAFGHALFPGGYAAADLAATSLARVFHPFEAGQARLLARLAWTHFGLAFPALSVPALWALAGRARSADRPRAPLWLALAAAGALAIYATTPYSGMYNSPRIGISANTGTAFRLGFPFLGLLAALGAVGWTRWKAKDGLLLALVAAGFALWARGRWGFLIGSALLAAFALWTGGRRGLAAGRALRRIWDRFAAGRGRAGIAGAASIALAASAAGLMRAEATRDANRSKRDYGPAAAFLDAAPRRGDAIAFAAADHSYALFGADLRHRVEYRPIRGRAARDWAGDLRREGFAWVAVGPCGNCPADSVAALRRALDGDALDFTRGFGAGTDGEITLYRLEEGRAGRSAAAGPADGSPAISP